MATAKKQTTYQKSVKKGEKAKSSYNSSVDANYKQYADSIDKSTEENANRIQTQSEADQGKINQEYQRNYDMNAIAKATAEKILAEKIANNGLSQSGLNTTQQTAIELQKNNADNAVGQKAAAAKSQIISDAANNIFNLRQTSEQTKNGALYDANNAKTSYAGNIDQGILNSWLSDMYAKQQEERNLKNSKALADYQNKLAKSLAKYNSDLSDKSYANQMAVKNSYSTASGSGSSGSTGKSGSSGGTVTNPKTFTYTPGGITYLEDKDGNMIYTDAYGNKKTVEKGENPFVLKSGDRVNKDLKGDPDKNAFANGYQPNNVDGYKLKTVIDTKGNAITDKDTGHKVWSYTDANNKAHYVVWYGEHNKYFELTDEEKKELEEKLGL